MFCSSEDLYLSQPQPAQDDCMGSSAAAPCSNNQGHQQQPATRSQQFASLSLPYKGVRSAAGGEAALLRRQQRVLLQLLAMPDKGSSKKNGGHRGCHPVRSASLAVPAAWGMASDSWGRKLAFGLATLFTAVFGFATAAAPNFQVSGTDSSTRSEAAHHYANHQLTASTGHCIVVVQR